MKDGVRWKPYYSGGTVFASEAISFKTIGLIFLEYCFQDPFKKGNVVEMIVHK